MAAPTRRLPTTWNALCPGARHRVAALADGAVDAQHAAVSLVQDGVDRDRGLAGLAVADDQLALAAAHRHGGVHRLQPGRERARYRRALEDAGGFGLDRPQRRRVQWLPTITGTAQGIDDPAQQGRA